MDYSWVENHPYTGIKKLEKHINSISRISWGMINPFKQINLSGPSEKTYL